jgi:hypothetical protein
MLKQASVMLAMRSVRGHEPIMMRAAEKLLKIEPSFIH